MSVRPRAVVLAVQLAGLLAGGCATNEPPPALETGPKRSSVEASSAVVALRFSTDSHHFAHLCEDGTIHLRHVLHDGASILRAPGDVTHLTMSRGTRFAMATGQRIEVWSSTTTRETALDLARPDVRFLTFDPSGERLAAAAEDGTVSVWELATGKKVRSIAALPGESPLQPGPGFSVLYASGDAGLRLRRLDLDGGTIEVEVPRHRGGAISVSRDARTLATIGPGGAVELRTLPDGALRQSIGPFRPVPRGLTLAPDGSVVAVVLGADALELWDTGTGERLDRFASPVADGASVEFSPDGFFAAWIEGDGKTVRFWPVAQDIVLWQGDRPVVIERARDVCKDLASMVRFRLAAPAFERGRKHLAREELAEAVAQFDKAAAVFPAYPGLDAAAGDARQRLRAQARAAEVTEQLRQLEAKGGFAAGLKLLEEFLGEHEAHGTFGHAATAQRLRDMLRHLDTAAAHVKEGRDLEALLEYDAAVALHPGLEKFHPEYGALRGTLGAALTAAADKASAAGDHRKVLEVYADLRKVGPLDPRATLQVGIAHHRLDQAPQAQAAYASIPEGAAEYSRARQLLAHLAIDAEDLARARVELAHARRTRPPEVALETEYAALCERLLDFDATVEAWRRIAGLAPKDPAPMETVGRIEAGRGRLVAGAEAWREAVKRSKGPRPDLLLKIAGVFLEAGETQQALWAWLDLLEMAEAGATIPTMEDHPVRRIHSKIRAMGFVRHRGKWISRDQFLSEQGWVRDGERWLRPEEAQLARIAKSFADVAPLRVQSAERYADEVAQKGILKGMNRREVIQAWGLFHDQNVVVLGGDEGNRGDEGAGTKGKRVRFEQLLFGDGRRVYLRDGEVFFWSE